MAPELFTTDEAAKQLRTKPATLQWWRTQGRGPRYIKIGGKVFYRLNDLEAFIVEHEPSKAA